MDKGSGLPGILAGVQFLLDLVDDGLHFAPAHVFDGDAGVFIQLAEREFLMGSIQGEGMIESMRVDEEHDSLSHLFSAGSINVKKTLEPPGHPSGYKDHEVIQVTVTPKIPDLPIRTTLHFFLILV